jgi:hypothetical protein
VSDQQCICYGLQQQQLNIISFSLLAPPAFNGFGHSEICGHPLDNSASILTTVLLEMRNGEEKSHSETLHDTNTPCGPQVHPLYFSILTPTACRKLQEFYSILK